MSESAAVKHAELVPSPQPRTPHSRNEFASTNRSGEAPFDLEFFLYFLSRLLRRFSPWAKPDRKTNGSPRDQEPPRTVAEKQSKKVSPLTSAADPRFPVASHLLAKRPPRSSKRLDCSQTGTGPDKSRARTLLPDRSPRASGACRGL